LRAPGSGWPAAIAASRSRPWLIGAVSLAHARRVFCMITLGLAQMCVRTFVNSMKAYGRRRKA